MVNHLDDEYSLCFPPLAILSRLAISKTMSMEIAKELFFRDYQYAYCE
ncbi:hypothetical protein GNP84_18065 [Aliivibrio fischeri]|nr:hypothetical protein [Aliivibrio fischeri]